MNKVLRSILNVRCWCRDRLALHAISSLSGGMLAVSLAALLVTTPVLATQSAPADKNDSRPKVLVLGDSISAEYGLKRGTGWVELLRQRLNAQARLYQIVNASISGETTAGGRSRIEQLLERHQPDIVIVELGGNDALRGLDLSSTHKNIRQIAQKAANAHAKTLLLGMRVPPNYGRRYGERFSQIYRDVAQSEATALVPFFFADLVGKTDMFQTDRIHPTQEAQKLLLETMWPAFKSLLL